MAKLPKYELSVTPPTNLVTPDFSHKGGLGDLGREVGKVLRIRGEQLVKEYDTVKAVDAYNGFSDSSRSRVGEFLKLERADADGIQDSYKEWVLKESSDFSQSLNSRPQQDMYNEMVSRRREADLNVLARYENQEWRKRKQDTFNKHIVETEGAIRAATVAGLNDPMAAEDLRFIEADGVLEGLIEKLPQLQPGKDLTVKQAEIIQELRSVMIQEMADRDPALAGKYLEIYKPQLREAYFSLKNMINGKISDSRLDAAFIRLMGENGDNYEKSMGIANNPTKWQGYDIDYDISQRLDNRLNGLRSERDRKVTEIRRLADLRLEESNESTTVDYYAGKNVNLLQLLKERKIDSKTYEHLTQAVPDSLIKEDPFTKGDLDESLIRGEEDFKAQLKLALHNKHIKGTTYSTYLKQYNNNEYKAGSAYIARAIKPSDADKYDQDKALKYADAQDLYRAKIKGGMDYDTASKEVVAQALSETQRTIRQVLKPKYLKGEKTDIDALEMAKYETAIAFEKGLIGVEEYKREIQSIEDLLKILKDNQDLLSIEDELEAARKKRR